MPDNREETKDQEIKNFLSTDSDPDDHGEEDPYKDPTGKVTSVEEIILHPLWFKVRLQSQ